MHQATQQILGSILSQYDSMLQAAEQKIRELQAELAAAKAAPKQPEPKPETPHAVT